jgi:hypothetical protein
MSPDGGGSILLRPVGREKMMFKPNYGQQRAERKRAQNARREEKLREQQEATARRRAAKAEAEPSPSPAPKADGE